MKVLPARVLPCSKGGPGSDQLICFVNDESGKNDVSGKKVILFPALGLNSTSY